MLKTVFIILACVTLAGCATVGHLATPSGRPEVFIENVTNKDVTNKCVSILTANGWQVEQATEYMVQAVHTSDNMMADFLFGTSYDFHQTWWRMIITLAQEPNGVRVYAVQKIVSNRGTGFEHVMDLTNQKAYQNTQNFLEQLRVSMTGFGEATKPSTR